jgi:hypothetical protein
MARSVREDMENGLVPGDPGVEEEFVTGMSDE